MTYEERTYEDYSEKQWTRRESSRKGRCLVSAATITVLIVIGILYLNLPNHSLRWHVDEGDEFTFSIVYHLAMNESLTDPDYLNAWREPLNDTVVIFQIVDLPEIPSVLNPQNFIDVVSNHIKSSCRFENGTAVPEPCSSELNSLFSYYLLPAGDWELLDNLFADIYDFEDVEEEIRYEYLTWMYGDYFYMSYLGMSTSEIRGSFCTINMDTGMLIMIDESVDTFDSSGFAFCDIMLIAM